MRGEYAEVMQKTGIEKVLFGGEARLLSGRRKKRREGKSARKNKWSAGESGTSGWSGQRARASLMGDVSGQFEAKLSTESSESGSKLGIPRSARRAEGKFCCAALAQQLHRFFQGISGNSAGQSRNFFSYRFTGHRGRDSNSSTAQLDQSNKLGDGGGGHDSWVQQLSTEHGGRLWTNLLGTWVLERRQRAFCSNLMELDFVSLKIFSLCLMS
ncbi:hypothetical protein QBC40DRAFT_28122 [Triangularia verruculosa]|uniref:Uncharacterized protein n=1 Tax=Triangularia verruculosa TaxID=2587418 RepID=A0AAN6X6C7_9PEZI|nr:hypothetical protein QBC40DRAFT_28122 [Triangularia verruculosa]